MKPTGPIPPHFSTNDAGELLIGGLAPEELVAEAGGTPLFIYDNNIVGGQIAALRAAMPDGLAVYYSVSANPYEPLLNFIGRYVEGFRVVSRGELEHLKRAGLAGIGMTFAGPGKTDDELQAGIAAGATISVESEGEAARAIRAGEQAGAKPKLAVRVNPPFSIDRRGLHVFAAAQCLDDSALIEAHKAIIACAGEICSKVDQPLPELNLGGGFDVPCFAGEEPIDLYRLANALHETVRTGPELLATT